MRRKLKYEVTVLYDDGLRTTLLYFNFKLIFNFASLIEHWEVPGRFGMKLPFSFVFNSFDSTALAGWNGYLILPFSHMI
ncbi:hypothetical protein BpHYR1_000344 [Brachionus plicatilis]|uniref:Uncharacterized protein n=1 Tax=Brachionus plicatilis TaxID=10195 RepID=A0A3M7SCU7_BRAPC|nr:hypothetical protein BpHYR1_000344 [Brachionus plicatilis]